VNHLLLSDSNLHILPATNRNKAKIECLHLDVIVYELTFCRILSAATQQKCGHSYPHHIRQLHQFSNFLSIHSSPFLKTLTRPHIKSETLTKKNTEPWSNLLKKYWFLAQNIIGYLISAEFLRLVSICKTSTKIWGHEQSTRKEDSTISS